MIPPLVTLLLLHGLLVAAGLILFVPPGPRPEPRREARRRFNKYGSLLLLAALVLILHLIEVQVDPLVTEALGWDVTGAVQAVEGDAVAGVRALWSPALTALFSVTYLLVHPWMLYFLPLLFVVTDEERAARAALMAFPLLYGPVLLAFLFLPVEAPYLALGLASPLFRFWGGGAADVYYAFSAPYNAFPALSVGLALLLANAARYSRNTRLQAFVATYATVMVAAPVYLALTWLTSVVAAGALAVAVAVLTSRIISVERIALMRVKPGPEEAQATHDAAQALVTACERAAEPLGAAEAMLVGSVAKDTYLAGQVDLDVFVLFPPDLPREDLEARGLKVGRAVIPEGRAKYAEHPYISGQWRGYPADVVPAYRVGDAAARLSAVDRTPFHTRYVLQHMRREQRDETRLLKRFMRGVDCYGAEARVRGFSGYLCELLVLKFGTFRGVVEAARRWRPGQLLSLEPLPEAPEFDDALVFIDPVDPERNAASAVAGETLERFVAACRSYTRRPRLRFFFPRQLVPLTPPELERAVDRRGGVFLLLVAPRPTEALEDHLWDQARKARAALSAVLERHDFRVRGGAVDVDASRVRVLLEAAPEELPEGEVHLGPPLTAGEHADRFRKAWQSNPDALGAVYEEDGRLKVHRRRAYRRPGALVRDHLEELDLGKRINRQVAEGEAELLEGAEVAREEHALLVTRYLSTKKPWQR